MKLSSKLRSIDVMVLRQLEDQTGSNDSIYLIFLTVFRHHLQVIHKIPQRFKIMIRQLSDLQRKGNRHCVITKSESHIYSHYSQLDNCGTKETKTKMNTTLGDPTRKRLFGKNHCLIILTLFKPDRKANNGTQALSRLAAPLLHT